MDVCGSLIRHFDEGSLYGAEEVQTMIECYRLRGSMSRKGNDWNNAVVERFFSDWKTELVADARRATLVESKSAVVKRIERWHNRTMMYSPQCCLGSDEFECQLTVETRHQSGNENGD